jgi:carboxymethylenebutenolidase
MFCQNQLLALLLALPMLVGSAYADSRADLAHDRAMTFFAALDGGNWAEIEGLVAADFVAINPRGALTSRAEFLSDLRGSPSSARAGLRREWSDVRTKAVGNEAVFSGRATWRSTSGPERRPISSRLVTQRWRHVGDRWQLVGMQTVFLPPPPEVVTFASGALSLKAMVFRPEGAGPLPAIVYAHGNEPDPSDLFETVGPALAARGYLVFGPHRRGAGLSADQGENLLRRLTDVERREGPEARARVAIEQLEGPQLDDIAAAVAAVRARPDVDRERVFLIGNSFGGVLVLLGAERGLAVAGAADFAGSAINWERSPQFRERLQRAASNAKLPLFLAQAENDYSTQPTRVLGDVLCASGKVHRARIYPPFGVTAGDGHSLGVDGVDRWADEVLGFLRRPSPASGCPPPR